MTYRLKFRVAQVCLVIGSLLVVVGAAEIQGSMGDPGSVSGAAWKLGIGFVMVAISAPLFYYFRARRDTPKTAEQLEVGELMRRSNTKNKGL